MEVVSYYRDPRNPEAVHFPAHLHITATYVFILLAGLATAVMVLIVDHGARKPVEFLIVAACLAVLALRYPKTITTDEAGVHSGGRFALRKRLIRWSDIECVRDRAIVPGIPAFDAGVLGNWELEIQSNSGERPIRFTCRHSGRKAFLYELRRWGAPAPATGPNPGGAGVTSGHADSSCT